MVNGVTAVPLARTRRPYADLPTGALAARIRHGVIEVRGVSPRPTIRSEESDRDSRAYLLRRPAAQALAPRMMALGSGDRQRRSARLIAQAFQSVGYPILPDMIGDATNPGADDHNREILTIRHFSLYSPRDFDISPYFEVVKPSIEHGIAYSSTERKQAPTLAATDRNGRLERGGPST